MREVIDALQRALDQVLSLLAHGTSDFVDATDGGNDPKLIARGGTTVGTAEAIKVSASTGSTTGCVGL